MPADAAPRAPGRPLPPAFPPGVRLHVVTGKGGTGKTTVATALALALAGEGRQVLLCEVEGRQGVARLLEVDDLPPREVEVAEGSGGGRVVALAVEPRTALLLYLETFYKLGRAGAALDRVGAVDFITAVAPGLRDILLVGMVYEAASRSSAGPRSAAGGAPGWAYDAVVLDAPPTGRIGKFLGIGDELASLAGGGPIAGQAASVARLLRSPATAVHVVTLLEELPAQESAEAVAELHDDGLPLGVVVANRVLAAPYTGAGRPEEATVASALASAGAAGGDAGRLAAAAPALLREGDARAQAVAGQQAQREHLAALGPPVVALPQVPGGMDLGRLYALADQLRSELP